jgi:hypothetical protein
MSVHKGMARSGIRRVTARDAAPGTEENLATWTKKLTGKPTITVGSITLDNSVAEMMRGEVSSPENNVAPLLAGLERGDFDLVGGKSADRQPRLAAPRPKRHSSRPLQPQHASDPRLMSFSRYSAGEPFMNTDTREVRL